MVTTSTLIVVMRHMGLSGSTDCLRLQNDLYCVEWGVKLYSLTRWRIDRTAVVNVGLSEMK